MKIFKRLAVIFIIAAFAVIVNSIKTDYTCGTGTSSPFSFLSKMFDSGKKAVSEKNESGELPMLGSAALAAEKISAIKVTFIELGSVNCIPCRMMQPVMKQVEEKYGKQVKVVFYDVWTEEGKPFGYKYGIQAIPTQVFLDSSGKEYFRHVGFYPFKDVEKALKEKGVR